MNPLAPAEEPEDDGEKSEDDVEVDGDGFRCEVEAEGEEDGGVEDEGEEEEDEGGEEDGGEGIVPLSLSVEHDPSEGIGVGVWKRRWMWGRDLRRLDGFRHGGC